MDTKKEEDKAFPAGYEHVEERLRETNEHVAMLEQQVNNTQKDRGATMVYRPPGYFGVHKPGELAKRVSFLRDQQTQLKTDALAKTERDTRDADPKTGRVVRDRVREALFPNPYRQIERHELAAHRSVFKEVEQAQDFADAHLKPKTIEAPEMSSKQEPEKTEPTPSSLSMRFSLSLGFTKLSEKSREAIAPTPSSPKRDLDKDRD